MSRFQKNDNFIDKTFTIMAEILLKVFPASEEEKEAFILYRNGLGAQTEGEYAEALDKYYDALDIEECSIDRGIIFYNIGLIYSKIGNYFKALECYHFALELNDRLTQIFNNTAVLYHTQGTKASKKKCLDLSRTLFYKASIYWKGALQLEPNYYIEAQNWLIVTNRFKNI
jgi:tetratricopeptide (TPR) repeat protein